MPPQWMWPFEDELVSWFQEVQAARDEKYGTSSSADDGPIKGDSMGNELTNEYM